MQRDALGRRGRRLLESMPYCRSGAPEEIRTPDPQIRSLVRAFDFMVGVVEPAIIRQSFQGDRREVLTPFDPCLTKTALGSLGGLTVAS